MTDEQKQLVVKVAEQLKKSEYRPTAVKIELEGRLNRDREYDDSREICSTCEGNGYIVCDNCDNSGWIGFNPAIHNDSDRMCESGCGCDGYDRAPCPTCESSGTRLCLDCDGGYQESEESRDWSSNTVCQDFILEYLSQFGLGKRIRTPLDRRTAERRTVRHRNYSPKGALRFCHFYHDPSVDSECTMTLMLKKPEDVLLLPKLIEAFNALGEAVGSGVDTTNAGMHISLIKDANGYYDEHAERTAVDIRRFRNFKRSMALLMPALYFLGATGEKTRSLYFRQPRIDDYEKHSAIYYIGTTVEFRVFDPCYDNPEQVLDNFVVMANAMQYWASTYKDPRLDKAIKARSIRFGHDDSDRTDRFFSTVKHIDLLNAGLRKLKPSYRTIRELKKQRGFKTTKGTFAAKERELRRQAELSYLEYSDRFDWKMRELYHHHLSNMLAYKRAAAKPTDMLEPHSDKIEKEVKAEVVEIMEKEKKKKKTLAQHIEETIANNQTAAGRYTLAVE